MEVSDKELLESLCKENEELRKLVEDHEAYEKSLEAYASRRYLTDAERAEVARLKRQKLAGKDRIERMLVEARRAAP